MSENLMTQLMEANNQPDQSFEEYKAERNSESHSTSVREVERSIEPRVESKVESKVERRSESEVEPIVEEKEYKPWEDAKTGDTTETEDEDEDVIIADNDKRVPLHKMLKVKARQKEAVAEAERLKNQLAEYESLLKKSLPKEEVEVVIDPIERKIKELKSPDPNQFNDWETYKAAQDQYNQSLEVLKQERIKNDIIRSFKEEQEALHYKSEQQKVVDAYVNKIEEASKVNPEIKKAVNWFENKMLENGGLKAIDQIVQKALVNDDNAPELIYRVVKDRKLTEDIFAKGDSSKILKQLGKISAMIDLEKDDSEDETRIVSRPKNVPKTVSGISSGSPKSSEKAESMDEYKKLRYKEEMAERAKRRR